MKKNNGTIVYIGGFELPDKNAAAHRVINNSKILADIGYNVVFIGVSRELSNDNEPKQCFGFDYFSVKYPCNMKQWIEYLTRVNKYILILSKIKDVKKIICYNCPSIVYRKLLNYAKNNRVRIYADITEWYGAQGKNIIFRIFKGIDSFYRMRLLNKKGDGIIVISDYLEKYYNKKLPTLLLPPLIDITEYKWNIGHQNSIKSSSTIDFVYSGNPGFKKDKINLIVKAFHEIKKVSNFTFSVVGISKNEYLELYPKDKKVICSLNDKIRFYGKVDHHSAISILKDASYSIIIRDNNIISNAGFPTKFVESITCGVPVIANMETGLSKYLLSGANGLLVNKKSLSSELENILILYNNSSRIEHNVVNREIFDFRNYELIVEEFFKVVK